MLADGKWHTLEEIRQSAKIDTDQFQRITDFLKEYDFIITDEAKNRIKLNKMAQKLLRQEATA
jgi:uncharacterized protein YutD